MQRATWSETGVRTITDSNGLKRTIRTIDLLECKTNRISISRVTARQADGGLVRIYGTYRSYKTYRTAALVCFAGNCATAIKPYHHKPRKRRYSPNYLTPVGRQPNDRRPSQRAYFRGVIAPLSASFAEEPQQARTGVRNWRGDDRKARGSKRERPVKNRRLRACAGRSSRRRR